ncbi:hypothetical protein KC460_04625 [Candidatus Dependentiae bacterium]|nr:hypothetical protein [Candidatus Dependentiae bacterium]
MNQKVIVFVIYDGINNSVFESQVLETLLKKQHEIPLHNIHIISYEHNKPSGTIITRLNNLGITLHILKKKRLFLYPFVSGTILSYSLKKTLSQFSKYECIARGPFAGYMCLYAIKNNCSKLIVQARGLLSEEHKYIHSNEKNVLLHLFYMLRAWQLKKLEKWIYQTRFSIPFFQIHFQPLSKLWQANTKKTAVHIEAVSPALKKYLIKTYNADPKRMSIAQDDIPEIIPTQKVQRWRNKIRTKLKIHKNAYVYCYNGSAKAWQCPELIVDFFAQQLKHNTYAFLLILTQDTEIFLSLLRQKNIPKQTYLILYIPYKNIYQYLSVANAGILFRKKHIINWISRPTKILEYNAVGLLLIHNNTIAYTRTGKKC